MRVWLTNLGNMVVPEPIHNGPFSNLTFYRANSKLGAFHEIDVGDDATRLTHVRTHRNWRNDRDIIVPGHFGSGEGGRHGELLFYDRKTGRARFYKVKRDGSIDLIKEQSWNAGWDNIIPGNFNDLDAYTDLLFYDSEQKRGWFYSTDRSGDIATMRKHSGWLQGWDIIVPGNFNDDRLTDLLFYDRETGRGWFYSTDRSGGIAAMQKNNWRKDWDIIVPININGDDFTDLLFYRKDGYARFFTTDGTGRIRHLRTYGNWRGKDSGGWDQIVRITPGLDDTQQALLFYRKSDGLAEVYKVDTQGGITRTYGKSWWKNWDVVLSYPK